jgi:hypothetical protein
MKVAVEQVFNGSLPVAVGGYDPDKINVGPHTGQYNLGSGDNDKFVGPSPVNVGYFGESSMAIPSSFVHPVKINNDLWWIFGQDAATAAATRRVQLWTWVPSTASLSLSGAVNLIFPAATVGHIVRGLRASLNNYTSGTVGVSTTTVTGSGTQWTVGLSVGSRIGFGSTDPNQIPQWYEIASIDSDTQITLTSSAGSISAGSSYVIQDLMLVTATTNTTATNGGLFVVKGLRPELFTNPQTNIPAATTVDKIRAVYWIKDAATVTNTVAGGCALEEFTSFTEQYAYVCNGAGTALRVFKYNFRAPLTALSAGAHVLGSPDLITTGTQTVTGNVSQINNGRIATLGHGPGNGVSCLYLLTSTRILRVPVSSITQDNTTFVADAMSEVVPSGTTTHVATTAFTTFDYSPTLDRLVIGGATSFGTSYIAQYDPAGGQFDRRFGSLTSQINSSLRDPDSPVYPHSTGATVPILWAEDGWLFWTNNTVVTTQNQLLIYPMAADWSYASATNNRVICPQITLGASASKLYRVLVSTAQNIGGPTLGVTAEACRVLYRTSGIEDNTGLWTEVPTRGNLSGVGTPSAIQFAIEFRTLGTVMMPSRLFSLALLYESADPLPSQYRWNFGDFDSATGTFAWVQASLFNGAPGVHTINIYRSDTNALVLTQESSSSTNGEFQYWNGSSWVGGVGPDSVGLRRRFVPSGSIPGGVDLYATLAVS